MSIDALIFVGYLIVLSIVGFVTAKWMKTADEYIVAGRRLKLWLAFSTVAATWIGGGITIGVAGKAYAGKEKRNRVMGHHDRVRNYVDTCGAILCGAPPQAEAVYARGLLLREV
ncbi:MAG: hypothetical protein J7L51_03645 [Desulfurococcales archaeon]|nr:hypothetical protein [Desulfurococcales archaeon]